MVKLCRVEPAGVTAPETTAPEAATSEAATSEAATSEAVAQVPPDVEVRTAPGVRTVRLARPAKRNAITSAMYAALADAFANADADDDVRVVLLTGSGGSFTAGNDLADMAANPPLGDDAPPLRFLDALAALRPVLVAAVDGPAIGVGTTVLLHCDLVYATARSTFRLPFVNLGLVPEAASTLLLPRLVGAQKAAELTLFGEPFDAAEAHRLGLVTAVTEDAVALDALVEDRVQALAGKPGIALRETKRLLRNESAATVAARLDLDRRVMQRLIEGQQRAGARRGKPV
jgi:enoyl-CoA hydratase/carnithine racemase